MGNVLCCFRPRDKEYTKQEEDDLDSSILFISQELQASKPYEDIIKPEGGIIIENKSTPDIYKNNLQPNNKPNSPFLKFFLNKNKRKKISREIYYRL